MPLSLLMIYEQYDRAYELIMGTFSSELRVRYFIRHIFGVVIAFGRLGDFQKFILAQNSNLTIACRLETRFRSF
jgi:hypothetical protein